MVTLGGKVRGTKRGQHKDVIASDRACATNLVANSIVAFYLLRESLMWSTERFII